MVLTGYNLKVFQSRLFRSGQVGLGWIQPGPGVTKWYYSNALHTFSKIFYKKNNIFFKMKGRSYKYAYFLLNIMTSRSLCLEIIFMTKSFLSTQIGSISPFKGDMFSWFSTNNVSKVFYI